MNRGASEPLRRSPNWLWPVATALCLSLVARHAMAAGTWLDEYWQLWISGAAASDLAGRLIADAHPPWFNLFARLILLATGGSIVPARILNLSAATAVLGLGLWRIGSLEPGLRWRIALLLLASAGAVGLSDLGATFRAYPWLLVLAGLQSAVLAALVLRREVPLLLTAVVTGASIAVHYVHAAGAIAIALTSMFIAWQGVRSSVRPLAFGLVAGVLLDVITGLTQLPTWRVNYDVNWIAESGGGAAASFAAFGIDFLLGNFVTAALIVLALIKRQRSVMLLLAPIPLALAAWLILDSITPMLVPRYIASVTALLATGAALAWWELGSGMIVDLALALLALLQPLVSSMLRPPLRGWEAGAKVAAELTKACPQARLYAISPWRFRDHPDSRAARFEEPVIGFGYRKVGRAFGLTPEFVTHPTALVAEPCPAIIWMEAAHGIDRVAAEKILRHAQLRVAGAARVRVIPTPNGAVLLISPADRLQPRT